MIFRGGDVCADCRFPMETYFGVLYCGDNYTLPYSLPQKYPFSSHWGASVTEMIMTGDDNLQFKTLEIAWLSLVEGEFYYLNIAINSAGEMTLCNSDEEGFPKLIVGLAPGGKSAIWFDYGSHSILYCWVKSKKIDIPMSDFLRNISSMTLTDYCKLTLQKCPKSLEYHSTELDTEKAKFDRIMCQYVYRIIISCENWDENRWTKSDYIVEPVHIRCKMSDGTFDNRSYDRIAAYQKRATPLKIFFEMEFKKKSYEVFICFVDNQINDIYHRFLRNHPETKTDFIIRIDAENKKYELALYRQGLKEPVVIPESAYQLIVFKNKFEDYRSENYNQPRGAWIW